MEIRELRKLRKYIKKKYSKGMDRETKEALSILNDLIREKELREVKGENNNE